MIKVIINGVTVNAKEGMTILEVASKSGFYIPSLCSYPILKRSDWKKIHPLTFVYWGKTKIKNDELSDVPARCGLCVVRVGVEGRLVRACDTVVEDGMVIMTETQDVQAIRRVMLENLLKKYQHPSVCITCEREERCFPFGVCSRSVNVPARCVACPGYKKCELLEIADYIGIKGTSLPTKEVTISVIDDNTFFEFDPSLCVGCLRCVRFCREVRGIGALGFVISHGKVVVGTIAETFEESNCNFCLACAEICPTAALIKKEEKWAQ